MKSLDCKAFALWWGSTRVSNFLEGVEVIARNYQFLFPLRKYVSDCSNFILSLAKTNYYL